MTIYAVSDGFNVADMSLNTLVPQPRCRGVRPTIRNHSASGTVHDQGDYVEFEFSTLESVASYQAILTQFGLNTAVTNEVTVRARSATFADVRLNGLAIRPVIDDGLDWSEYFPRNVVILIKGVEAAS